MVSLPIFSKPTIKRLPRRLNSPGQRAIACVIATQSNILHTSNCHPQLFSFTTSAFPRSHIKQQSIILHLKPILHYFNFFSTKNRPPSFKMTSASSMPPTDQSQNLKRLMECSICLEIFDDPRTLPCQHSFCKKCLENFVDGKREDELNCPVCRCNFTLNKGKDTTLLETYI